MKPAIRLIRPAEESVAQAAFERGKKEGKEEAIVLAGSAALYPLSCPEKGVWPSTPQQGVVSVTYSYGVEHIPAPPYMGTQLVISVTRRDQYGEAEICHRSQLPHRDFHALAEIDESLISIVADAARAIPCDAIALVWTVVPMVFRVVHHDPVDSHNGAIHCRNLVHEIISRLYDEDTTEIFMSQR